MKRPPTILLVAAVLLLIGVAVSVWASWRTEPEKPWAPLATRLPMNIEGWEGQDVPLGETEAVRNEVGKLNYDDYLYRIYRKDGKEVFVYAMFWRQGQISVREMAGHTPDGCWVAGGAKHCVPPVQTAFAVDKRPTLAGEARKFSFPGGHLVNVVWWHLWGGETVSRTYAAKNVMPMLWEIREWLVRSQGRKREQLMIRIHGADALDQLVGTPPASTFLLCLPAVFGANPASAKP